MQPVEVIERKGQGHPDTLCDAIAERVSVKLCRAYLSALGSVLHHNVDKVLLCGGAARPAFGGGEVTAPMEIHLIGRVTRDAGLAIIPVEDIAIQACREVLGEHVRALDLDRHVRIFPHFHAGSADLTELFGRAPAAKAPLANDTSIGTGFAPEARPLQFKPGICARIGHPSLLPSRFRSRLGRYGGWRECRAILVLE